MSCSFENGHFVLCAVPFGHLTSVSGTVAPHMEFLIGIQFVAAEVNKITVEKLEMAISLRNMDQCSGQSVRWFVGLSNVVRFGRSFDR